MEQSINTGSDLHDLKMTPSRKQPITEEEQAFKGVHSAFVPSATSLLVKGCFLGGDDHVCVVGGRER